MSAVGSLMKELDGISTLIDAQEKAGLHKDEILQSLFRSWSARLSTQPMQKLSVLERQQLTAAITACPWSAEQCKSLAETVLTCGSRKLTASNIKTTQKCHNFENFIPTDVVLKLKARKDDAAEFTVLSRLTYIAGAARKIGLVNPDEGTLFRMVGILCVHDSALQGRIEQQEVFYHMNTLQEIIKAPGCTKQPMEFIEVYPPSARFLPQEILEAAFPDNNIPPEVVMPALETVLASFRMRGGRKHLKEPTKRSGAQDVRYRQPPTPNHAQEPEHRPLPSPETLRLIGLRSDIIGDKIAASPLANSQAKASSAGDAQQLCSVCGTHINPALAGQVCDDVLPTADATVDQDAADPAKPKAVVTLEDFENGMIGALDVRKETKKAKKRPASTHIMKKPAKRPAASPAACSRRPAGGCSKCRGYGCDTCSNPDFTGWRGNHDEWKAKNKRKRR